MSFINTHKSWRTVLYVREHWAWGGKTSGTCVPTSMFLGNERKLVGQDKTQIDNSKTAVHHLLHHHAALWRTNAQENHEKHN